MLTACAVACVGFVALGAWQVERLGWKEALIARVERNANGAPVPAPGPAQWDLLTRDDEYRRVQVHGRLDYEREVLVAATTGLGQGFWVLTPLQTQQGHWVLVNRGFVPSDLRERVPQGALEETVTGLLRFSEPGGRLLQKNDAAEGRWYSRDVAAIAQTQHLPGTVAPYFVDEVALPGAPADWPRPGLTVLQFPNNHLVYALTWFALAAMTAAAVGYVLLDHRRRRPTA
ncbi:SURF1 family protein [Ramlibacter sp. USB13]|uniref:SURF1-like protein n=2 Tax=Ramlibacter cellulosilyticus TaxID=2764187 RepID=A0A923MPW0_9BURK|nr:SURF1 family protein [Ramlibacter cellulosilyticus]